MPSWKTRLLFQFFFYELSEFSQLVTRFLFSYFFFCIRVVDCRTTIPENQDLNDTLNNTVGSVVTETSLRFSLISVARVDKDEGQ